MPIKGREALAQSSCGLSPQIANNESAERSLSCWRGISRSARMLNASGIILDLLTIELSIKTNIHNSPQALADYKAMSESLLLEPVDRVVHGLRLTLCAVVFGSAIDRFSNLRRAPTHHPWSLQNALNAYLRDAPTRFKV